MTGNGAFRRFAIVTVLLGAVCILLIWYGALGPAPSMGVPPGDDDVMTDYEAYVGERVLLSGPIVETDPVRMLITAENGESTTVAVDGIETPVAIGDVVSVYGVLEQNNRLTAIETVRKSADNYLRTRVLSLLAGLWVFWRGVRYWKFTLLNVRIVRRDPPLRSIPERLKQIWREEGA